MKKYIVNVFTEEYAVNVIIGKYSELVRELSKYTTYSPKTIAKDLKNRRGVCYDLFPEKNPVVAIDGELPYNISLPTLAHETIHAVDSIADYLGIKNDTEFRGHCVACVMRTVLKGIKLKNY